jgi:hypothetical protein
VSVRRLVLAVALVAADAGAKPTAPPPLPFLPSIPRVKVTSHAHAVAVIEEVNLPRGDWRGEELHFHVAFGAPGPKAIDARLVPVADGALEADDAEAGDVVETERVPRRPANASSLLGRDTMAGIVVHVRTAALTKAFARGNMATLRIRSLADATELDAEGASSVVVRLGTARSTPLTLGRILATSAEGTPPLLRVEAHLCGADADPHPLAVGILAGGVLTRPHGPEGEARQDPPIAPVLAVRHATDDLCLRLWNASERVGR